MSALAKVGAPGTTPVQKESPPTTNALNRVLNIFRQVDFKPAPTQARLVSLAEVTQHATHEDGWTILEGHVYNVTKYGAIHPGGSQVFANCYGKDGTEAFHLAHKHRKIVALKKPEYYIGVFAGK